MPSQKKLFLSLSVLILVTLACTTVMGSGNTPDPPDQPPAGDPLPPPPTRTPPPTSTPQPEQPPAQLPVPTGELLFDDDFSDPNSGWDQFSNEEGFTDYANDSYKIGINTTTYYFWANPYRDFGDVIVEVDVSKTVGGDDSQFGIVCRHLDINNWYALVATSDGQVAIRKRLQGGELVNLTDWVSVSAINQGNAINTLRAECIGSRLTLFVNGVLAIETNDSDFSTGDVGLIGGTFDTADSVEYLFDNFEVFAPLEGGASPITPEPVAMPGAGPEWEELTTIFFDEFNDNSGGWDNFDNESFAAYQLGDEFLINIRNENWIGWVNPNLEAMANVVIGVDADLRNGEPTEIEYGIICRYQDLQNWYGFFLTGDGYAIAKKVVGDELENITEWVQAEGFRPGETNYLMAQCSGDTLILYVNFVQALSVVDTDIPAGDVGLIVGTYEESQAEVYFDNFRVGIP